MSNFRRYSGYYIDFTETKEPSVDKILSSVAFAAKGYHHTEGWREPVSDWGDNKGGSHEAWIQSSANECAEIIKSKDQTIKQLEDALKDIIFVLSNSSERIYVGDNPTRFPSGWYSIREFYEMIIADFKGSHQELLTKINEERK